MKDVVQYCDKTIDTTTTEISTTVPSLKSNKTKQLVKRCCNNKKYKPQPVAQPKTRQEDEVQEKSRNPLYSDILKSKKATLV